MIFWPVLLILKLKSYNKLRVLEDISKFSFCDSEQFLVVYMYWS